MIDRLLMLWYVLFTFFEKVVHFLSTYFRTQKVAYFEKKVLYYAIYASNNTYAIVYDYDKWYYLLAYAVVERLFHRELFPLYSIDTVRIQHASNIHVASFIIDGVQKYRIWSRPVFDVVDRVNASFIFANVDDSIDITETMELFKESVAANTSITTHELCQIFGHFTGNTHLVDIRYPTLTFEMDDVFEQKILKDNCVVLV